MTEKINQLIHLLGQLQNISYEDDRDSLRHNATADAALRLIFHIGREEVPLEEEQKESVARHLAAAIRAIQLNVEAHGFEYIRRVNSLLLKKRSALQFLVDVYGSLPLQGQTLSAVFERVNLNETIGILDQIIRDHTDDSDSEDAYSDREFPGIPTSHYWWQ